MEMTSIVLFAFWVILAVMLIVISIKYDSARDKLHKCEQKLAKHVDAGETLYRSLSETKEKLAKAKEIIGKWEDAYFRKKKEILAELQPRDKDGKFLPRNKK